MGLEYAIKRVVEVWSESFYTKPILEVISVYCYLTLWKSKCQSDFKQVAKIFCLSTAILFIIIDLSFLSYLLAKPRFYFYEFVQYQEALNGLFSFVEWYAIYKIVNFGIKDKSLITLGRVIVLCLITKELILRITLIGNHNIEIIQSADELSSGMSFALFTLYFTFYYLKLYRLNLMSTFLTPSAYAMFSYVVLSLLFFPCSYFLILQNNPFGFVIYAYHALLAGLVCMVFRYNVLFHRSKNLNYLEFQT